MEVLIYALVTALYSSLVATGFVLILFLWSPRFGWLARGIWSVILAVVFAVLSSVLMGGEESYTDDLSYALIMYLAMFGLAFPIAIYLSFAVDRKFNQPAREFE